MTSLQKPEMNFSIDDIKNNSISLLYEQALLCFLNFKKNLFYFPTKAPKENNGISVPVYRASIHNLDEFFITAINRLSYRPADDVGSFGRVNRPYQAYFYASGEAQTCFTELNKRILSELEHKKEIAVTLSQWTLQRDLTVCVIPDWNNKEMYPFIQRIDLFKNLSQENYKLLKDINKLFLTEDDNSNIHQVTSAFCNAILYDAIRQRINIDGFLYTSVKNGIGFNLALLPNLIDDKNLILTKVCKTHIIKKDIEKKEFYFKPYIEAKSIDLINDKIIW
jgi:hypothetical protein